MMVYEHAVRDAYVFVMIRRIINVTCSPAICACASLFSSSSFRLDMEHDLPRRVWFFKNNLLAGIRLLILAAFLFGGAHFATQSNGSWTFGF